MNEKKIIHRPRKGILFLLSLCSLLALNSVGFAAFIVSRKVSEKVEGNITIGEVKDETTHFYDVSLSEHTISFLPQKEDKEGRVRSDGEGDEILATSLSFSFDHADLLSSLTIQLELTEGIRKAIEENYITLEDQEELEKGKVFSVDGPDYTSLDQDHIQECKRTDLQNGKSFTYTIRFGWGEKFANENPGRYYDETEKGKAVPSEQVASTLKEFASLLPEKDGKTSEKCVVNLSATNN